MRITIASGPMLPVPALRGGAIPRMWDGIARAFARAGHDVCLFARSYPGQPPEETIAGVRYLRWGGFDQGRRLTLDLARDFLYAARALRHLPKADILVTNDFWLPALAGLLRPAAGRIVVNANRFPKGQYFLYGRAARIAAASSAVRDALLHQAPRLAGRVRIFPNPVDLEVMNDREARRASDPNRLLYVGRLHPEKGVHCLAAAFRMLAARHPGWRLRIVGPWSEADGGGGEAYLMRLRDMLKGVPADFVGPVFDARALAEEYRSASLFCYPSLAEQGESFGLAPLEAMACGVAPVVSGLACFRDFVVDGRNGWVFDHRGAAPEAALAAALDPVLSDSGRRKAAGRQAAEAARGFGYEEIACRYLADFRSLLEHSGHA